MFNNRDILDARPPKNAVDPYRPYAFLVEDECTAAGDVVPTATVFLTNRECPFRCLMCDLWRNTTDEQVPVGAIPAQIDYALSRLPQATQIKLYNSGNFFDRRAIPPEDHAAIIERVRGFENVVVENHPRLTDDAVLRFRSSLQTNLEVAVGLETVHPAVLERLNKRMTVDDFNRAVQFLRTHGVAVRTFILLRPPFLSEEDGVEWAIRSIQHAFNAGVECCAVIPTRAGNGIMERLESEDGIEPTTLSSLERVMEAGLKLNRGRVFVDLWDVEKLCQNEVRAAERVDRLRQMNLTQEISYIDAESKLC